MDKKGVLKMHLQIEVNDTKSSMFLKLLETFKVGNIVNAYSVVADSKENETAEILADIAMLGETLEEAKKGLGSHTGRHIVLEDA